MGIKEVDARADARLEVFDYGPTDASGQHENYPVLSAEERSRGFVRPVYRAYKHVGVRPKHPLRELTKEEHDQYDKYDYVKFEAYPESESPVTGKFWTQKSLTSGCGTVTNMGLELCETYAREPSFYSATFCAGCRTHLPVGAHGEFVWDGTNLRVGT